MATAKDLRRLALALEGTSEAPHFAPGRLQSGAHLCDLGRGR